MDWTREQSAQRAAQELQDRFYGNLGIGLPTLGANYIPEGMDVWLQSENGLLGIGPFPTEEEIDPDLINAGKQTVTALPGSSFFDNAQSFAMIRGGHIRSEEHTSELQSLMRISYAVFCLKKQKNQSNSQQNTYQS